MASINQSEASIHLSAACTALEALRVPGCLQRADTLVQDGAPTPRTPDMDQSGESIEVT